MSITNHRAFARLIFLAALAGVLGLGCRGQNTGNGVPAPTAKVNLTGTSGCSTATPLFGGSTTAFGAADLAPYSVSSGGAICGKATEALAFVAIPGPAPGPAILELNLQLGTMTPFADAARLAAFDPAVSNLTGIAIMPSAHVGDPETLLVVDSSTNRILAISALSVNTFAGLSSPAGGFADGNVAAALFRFSSPTQLAIGGDGVVYISDPGNHRVRQIANNFVSTLAGSGVPGFLDGSGTSARFEQPDGIAIECEGTLLVTEATHRIRRLTFKSTTGSIFGGSSTQVAVSTVAGDGTGISIDGSDGPLGTAQVDTPGGLCVGRSQTGGRSDLFWLDRGNGTLRRLESGTHMVDTPIGAPSIAPFSSFGLCGTFDGAALLIDSAGAQILRIP